MTYTEKEARKHWCPFSRPAWPKDSDTHPGNRPCGDDTPVSQIAGCRCIASGCMAWRWAEKDREKCFHENGPTPDPDVWERVSPTGAIGVWPTYRRKVPRGYCGLAGKVQP